MVMVRDLQTEPQIVLFFFFPPVSDPGVAGAEPRDAHDLTGRDIIPVSARSRLQRHAPWRKPTRPPKKRKKSRQERCSGPRTEAGSAAGGGCGEEARPGSRRRGVGWGVRGREGD